MVSRRGLRDAGCVWLLEAHAPRTKENKLGGLVTFTR